MLKHFSIYALICLYGDVVLSKNGNVKTPEKVHYDLDLSDGLFDVFREDFKKSYSSEELIHRRQVFKDNLIKINRWNQEQPEAIFGIGPFADMTADEFQQTYTGCLGNYTQANTVQYKSMESPPESLDWREKNVVTRVKDQKCCGSCYIFSAIGHIEGQNALKNGQLIELSEQQSLDCNSNGCKGGYPHEVMQSLIEVGCMKESHYPYKGREGKCRFDASKVAVKVRSARQLSKLNEDSLKNAVADIGPLSIGMSTDMQLQHLQGGIFKPKECDGPKHAVLLVGYGSEGGEPYWLIKNSWGRDWNKDGYFKMIRGQGACAIGEYVASAIVA